jgi:hypothetical protein
MSDYLVGVFNGIGIQIEKNGEYEDTSVIVAKLIEKWGSLSVEQQKLLLTELVNNQSY